MASGPVTFIVPTFNEERVGDVVRELRERFPQDRVLVIDDGSSDRSSQIARDAGAEVVRHPYNKGNGAAVKTGLRNARTPWVVMLDADGQHPPEAAAELLEKLGEYDLVIGARDANAEVHWWRRLANFVFNRLASYLAGVPVLDLTSGFRAASRERMLEFLHLYPNGFSYPTTSTLSFLRAGYNVAFVPVTMRFRRSGESKIHPLRDGVRFLLIILKMTTLYNPLKFFVPLSLVFAMIGTSYGAWSFWASGRFANGAVLAWMVAFFTFLIGLISEQISALRLERRDAPE